MPESPRSRSERRAERHFERMREKVVQNLRDLWRGYHGSTAHPDDTGEAKSDSDGNRMVEKSKSGGHMPLNAAVMAFWDPEPDSRRDKLRISRDLTARELYRLACGAPEEVAMFSEIQDLFRDYGAGDSDYDELRIKAYRFGRGSQSAAKLRAVDAGIDRITKRLIDAGVTGRDLWADFPGGGAPTGRTKGKEKRYASYYLAYQRCRERLAAETKPDGTPRYKRVTNKALKGAAAEHGVTKQTVITAVQQFESGYLNAS